MKSYYVTFRSVTYAQRGEQVLRRAGIRCALQRTPKKLEEQGCGYCLRLREGDISTALELLGSNRVPFRKLYLPTGDGEVREAAL